MDNQHYNIDPAGLDKQPPDKQQPGPRDRILQASLELFVEQGYLKTNVPDISRKSNCSVGSIYHHFLNKEEIARRLYEDALRQFREALSSAIDINAELESTIRSLVIKFLEFSEQNPLLARYLWLARHNEFLTKRVSKPTVIGFDALGRKLTKIIKTGIRANQIAPLDAGIIWSIVFGIPLSYLMDWLDGYNKTTPTEIAPLVANACWAALSHAQANH